MKNGIFYFTGTGNSLNIARNLTAAMSDATISPMLGAKEEDINAFDSIGLVFPVYMFRPPHAVIDFIKKISKSKYIFVVAVNAGEVGIVFSNVKQLLEKQNLTLSAGFSIEMPSNYTPYGGAIPDIEQQKLFDASMQKVGKIAEIVNKREKFFDKSIGFFQANIHPGILYGLGYNFIPKMDKDFGVDENCNGCGICSQVCPVNNIAMNNQKPVWKHTCQQCYACLQWCPQEAVQMGSKTSGKRRYHHPEVTLKDMLLQKKE